MPVIAMKPGTAAGLLLLGALGACATFPFFGPGEIEQDLSVRFVPFPSDTTLIDGPTLQAIRVAADDFRPRPGPGVDCRRSQLGYRYRAFRSGDIIFVSVEQDTEQCGGPLSLHGDAKYAIGLDGTIRRRLYEAQPDPAEPTPDRSGREVIVIGDGGLSSIDELVRGPADSGGTWVPPWEGRPDSGSPER